MQGPAARSGLPDSALVPDVDGSGDAAMGGERITHKPPLQRGFTEFSPAMLPRWTSDQIVALRPEAMRPAAADEPLSVLWEKEAADTAGRLVDVITVFLSGSECRFRCLMCDLWKHTYPQPTPVGSIPQQVSKALAEFDFARRSPLAEHWIKLYNASNFFASVNVPTSDLPKIASQVARFERVVVENHPKVLLPAISDFRCRLKGRLEVAMGLETVHPPTLERLNKQMTVDDFRHACDWLLERDIDVRAFLLLRPPGMSGDQGVEWCLRSAEFARSAGVRHLSIIPVRGGNGALEELAKQGLFEPPDARQLVNVMQQLLQWQDVVVTADLWDWQRLPCDEQLRQRLGEQLQTANLTQRWPRDAAS
jgi:archaeosine synthase beta-subunit